MFVCFSHCKHDVAFGRTAPLNNLTVHLLECVKHLMSLGVAMLLVQVVTHQIAHNLSHASSLCLSQPG